jgi:hypothetical protein
MGSRLRKDGRLQSQSPTRQTTNRGLGDSMHDFHS